jgi:beta-lactamase regulating signal transducer with metallopeptidase domain
MKFADLSTRPDGTCLVTYHPMVWWIGRRMLYERERACDEAVVRSGSEPQVYAESVLETCRFSIQSPMPCTAGMSGSDLAKRIEWIVRGPLVG